MATEEIDPDMTPFRNVQEIKLIILVFILVVAPAVAVSFFAGRVLGSWQIVLQKRMETDAVRVLDQAVANDRPSNNAAN